MPEFVDASKAQPKAREDQCANCDLDSNKRIANACLPSPADCDFSAQARRKIRGRSVKGRWKTRRYTCNYHHENGEPHDGRVGLNLGRDSDGSEKRKQRAEFG